MNRRGGAVAPRVEDAAVDDLSAIRDITNDAILHTTALWHLDPISPDDVADWWQKRKSAGFPILVVRDPAVCAYATFGPFRPFAGFAATVEHSIYVATEVRRQGLGRLLLAALEQRARDRGVHAMVAGIEAENRTSIALHSTAGFVECGRLHQVGRKFDRWLDLVFMQKLLEP